MAGFSLTGEKEKIYRLFDFSGGLNNKYTDTTLEDNEASDLLNMVFEERGHLYKRPGMKIDTTYPSKPSVEVLQINRFERRDGTKELFVFFKDGTITGKNQTGEYELVLKKGSAVVKHANRRFASFIMHNFFYFGNSVDGWFKYQTGKEAVLVETIPKCDYAVVKNARVYMAGESAFLDRVAYSHQGDPEDFTITVKTNETQENVGGEHYVLSNETRITGLEIFQGDVVIFKKDAIFVLKGDDYLDFTLQQLNVATGCVEPYTITRGDNMIYYMGYDGVYYIYSTSQEVVETKPISDKITPEFDGMKNAHGYYHKSKFFLFSPNKTLIFDERLNAWTKWDLNITSAYYDDDVDQILLGNDKGYLYTLHKSMLKDELEPDVFTPILGSFTIPYLHFGEPEITKRYRWLKAFITPNPIENSVINMKIEIDYKDQYKNIDIFYDALVWEDDEDEQEDNLWGEYWGDMRKQISKKVRFGGSGEFVKITFSNDKMDEELGIYGLVFGYKKKNKVK